MNRRVYSLDLSPRYNAHVEPSAGRTMAKLIVEAAVLALLVYFNLVLVMA